MIDPNVIDMTDGIHGDVTTKRDACNGITVFPETGPKK